MSDWAMQTALDAITIGACQNPTELAKMLDLITEHRRQTIVEIGTAQGATFWAMCQAAPIDATLISIDLGPIHPTGHSKSSATTRTANLDTTRDTLKLLAPKGIDFLFIDGDHRYEQVKRDHDLYSPLVNPGGIVGFHDIAGNDHITEVRQLWAELRDGLAERWEWVEHDGTFGIGAYRRT